MKRVLLLFCLYICLPITPAHAEPRTPCVPANIRVSPEWITRALCHHQRHSATLRRLLVAVGAAPLVVYVEEASATPRQWDGRIRFIGHAASWRYVVIDVNPHVAGPAVAALLAHELQHALEIDGGRVEDVEGVRTLFARIGFRTGAAGLDAFDTVAAIEAGVDTLHELTGREPLTPRWYRLSSRERR
jgi:hypothetical protein